MKIVDTLRFFSQHFFSILLLQAPEALGEIASYVFETRLEKSPIPIAVGAFLVLSALSGMSQALTYAFIISVEGNVANPLKEALARVKSHWRVLVAVCLLASSLNLAGLMLFVLPGLYIATLLLFAPNLVVLQPGAKPSVYLYRSRNLVRGKLLQPFVLVVACFLVITGMSLATSEALSWAGGDPIGRPIVYGVSFTLSTLVSAVIHLLIGFYLNQRRTQSSGA